MVSKIHSKRENLHAPSYWSDDELSRSSSPSDDEADPEDSSEESDTDSAFPEDEEDEESVGAGSGLFPENAT